MYKEILDNYFNQRYKFLKDAIRNINGRTKIPEELYSDLLNELYVYLHNKPDKWFKNYEQKGDKGIDAYCLVWIRNQSNWISTFKQKYDITIRHYQEYEPDKDERFEDEFKILSDEELLYSGYYSDEQVDRIICIKRQYSKLPDYYKNLYDLYFNKQLTMGQIEQVVGISKGSVHNMLHQLYDILRNKCRR